MDVAQQSSSSSSVSRSLGSSEPPEAVTSEWSDEASEEDDPEDFRTRSSTSMARTSNLFIAYIVAVATVSDMTHALS